MKKKKATTTMKCSICYAPITDQRRTCSAIPINDGRCCHTCDDLIVTPVRIARDNAQPILEAMATGMAIYKAMKEKGLRP